MKKFLVTLAALVLGLIAVVAAGCGTPKGKLYTLQEAYDSGFLSTQDFEVIARYLDKTDTCDETLDSGIEQSIKETAAYEMRHRELNPCAEAVAEGFTIAKFYGEYSGSYVVLIYNEYDILPTDVPLYWEEIGGVRLRFEGRGSYSVWKAN